MGSLSVVSILKQKQPTVKSSVIFRIHNGWNFLLRHSFSFGIAVRHLASVGSFGRSSFCIACADSILHINL